MLRRNTIHKLKTILLSVCMLFSASIFAQDKKDSDESIIVMTKSELNSFLSTIADARRAQVKERENRRIKQDLAELRLKHQGRSKIETGGYDQISNQQVLGELRYLNQRIDHLSYGNNALPSMQRDNSTIIMPSNSNPNPVYPPMDRASTIVIPSNNIKIKELQNQIDSLKYVEAYKENFKNKNSFADSLSAVNQRLKDVRKQLDSIETKMLASDKLSKTEKSTETRAYFKQQVYFDNNSETLRTDYFRYIQDLTQILIKYPEAKVMLEGWASTKGKAEYNKHLSMRRAEAVEKVFVSNGIAASRIISSFRGEDQNSSEQHARRVDMSIIVR